MHVRRGDTDAWRLDTASGSYFVKGYFATTGGQFNGEDLTDQLAVAMAFEGRALEAGVDMPTPIMPIDPLLGWVVRIEDRLFRVYEWVEHRPSEDVSGWLGRTMMQVHQLQPIGQAGLPKWWRQAVQSPATWEGWFAKARNQNASWAGLGRDSLPHILAVSARIEELCDVAPDLVTTHGDFKTHNIVMSPTGPVLVDWDSVRTDSAALEAARVAYLFGADQLNRILTAYAEAGGELGWPGPDLFLSVTRNHIQVLAEHIQVSLGESPAARWMGDQATIETAIATKLRDLPSTIDHLRNLAATVSN
ncbi:aminoglycoside phosphotransferase family protein [Kribbella kalugense]|uniref:Phosphotransferase family enzyme n=1 Tax=Kribbella kalugense TaxID=2512221 RepID=A0A4R8A281_9ACTN|nr:aminoglycoside phosphotransferase family protein [Kribbella kalugense]TDW24647.1 phosphotransferase family enzyme [Kribbella kalugense]